MRYRPYTADASTEAPRNRAGSPRTARTIPGPVRPTLLAGEPDPARRPRKAEGGRETLAACVCAAEGQGTPAVLSGTAGDAPVSPSPFNRPRATTRFRVPLIPRRTSAPVALAARPVAEGGEGDAAGGSAPAASTP